MTSLITAAPATSADIRAGLLAAADRLAPALAEASADIDVARRLPHDLVDRLAAEGFYAMLTPAVFGGLEVDVHTFVLAVERLARTEASSAWCAFIANTSAVIAGYLPVEAAKAVFTDRQVKLAGVFAPRGRARLVLRDGEPGYLVSGAWPWGSGMAHADWLVGGCVVMDETGQPEMLADGSVDVRSMLFEAAQVRMNDNWTALGLRGTGSGEFSVSDLFVPLSRSASILSGTPVTLPLYRFPVFCLLGVGIAAVALGIARTAIDSLSALALEKTPQGSRKRLAERVSVQIEIARAEARLRAARAFLLESVDRAWSAAQDGTIDIGQRRDLRLATVHATEQASDVVRAMYHCGGGSAIFESSPLQRCLRDVMVVTQHVMVGESVYELTGRLFLDLPTPVAML